MVEPIALYPDALVAQILRGATYPDQVVEAEKDLGAGTADIVKDMKIYNPDATWKMV